MTMMRFTSLLLVGFTTIYAASIETVNNGIVSIDVDLNVGCAITSFVDLSSGVNMINTADLGR